MFGGFKIALAQQRESSGKQQLRKGDVVMRKKGINTI
jgi:hypothetical protein